MQILELQSNDLMDIVQSQLAAGTKVRIGVTGTSMTPMLRHGKDSVLLCPPDAPKKGDILLYRRGDRYVLHRVVGFGETTLLCCGDNQWRKEPILPTHVDGVVCGYYRGEKKRPVSGFWYQIYVNLLPLRRIYCRLRDWLFHR